MVSIVTVHSQAGTAHSPLIMNRLENACMVSYGPVVSVSLEIVIFCELLGCKRNKTLGNIM